MRTTARRARPAPARRWGTFPTTADVGIWATGPDARSLLEGLGHALTSLLADRRKVRPRLTRTIAASGRDPGELVVAYLGELLALQDTEGFLARTIEVRPAGRPVRRLVARLTGEPFDPERHVARTEVKAVTYHDLRFDPGVGKARVIVDI